MVKLFIIGNLTRDPEAKSLADGTQISVFTVAVNRKAKMVDYYKVTAWRGLADNCNRYLSKGKKVAVTGGLALRTYDDKDGKTRASLEVQADEVEFLSPKDALESEQTATAAMNNSEEKGHKAQIDEQTGFLKVEDDDLPF